MRVPKRSHRLSKSRYLKGLQCHKRLWLEVHEPDAPELEVDDAQQAIFDTGHRVGERAQQEFGPGTLIELDPINTGPAVEATRAAIERGETVIFEASFSEDNVFVAVDVLSKEQGGWVLSEVKSTGRVKDQHVPDAAVQAHVLESAGLEVARLELMHLNTHPDEGPLFTRSDVTERAAAHRPEVASNIKAQLEVLAGPEPSVEPGDHCTSPYDCPFIERCCEAPVDHSIYELANIKSSKKKMAALEAASIERITDIPADFKLSDTQARQRRAVIEGKPVVEPGLKQALSEFEFPIAMLDFETVGATLPVWRGASPFQAIAAQFSVHVVHEDGRVAHHAFLAPSEDVGLAPDPRPSLAAALVPALAGANTVLAWNASFERRCLKDLAEASPEHRAALESALDKLADLLPVVRKNFYHPNFHGSFSIKAVAPALLPDLTYADLEVADGGTASNALEALLSAPEQIPAARRAQLRNQLLTYCNHDTLVMVELWRYLHRLADDVTP